MASTGSQAAGAAQAVTQGSDVKSRRRRREQMALKKTREPAARAHIQLASARRPRSAALPPPRRLLATRVGGGRRTGCIATELSFFLSDLQPSVPRLGSSGSRRRRRRRRRPLLRTRHLFFSPFKKRKSQPLPFWEGPRPARASTRPPRPCWRGSGTREGGGQPPGSGSPHPDGECSSSQPNS